MDLVWDGRRVDTTLLKTIPGWEYILYRILEGEGMEPRGRSISKNPKT